LLFLNMGDLIFILVRQYMIYNWSDYFFVLRFLYSIEITLLYMAFILPISECLFQSSIF
jgi:hypothetical protein